MVVIQNPWTQDFGSSIQIAKTNPLQTCAGNTLNVYDPNGKLLGSAVVTAATQTNNPLPANTQDVVFGSTYDYYTFFAVGRAALMHITDKQGFLQKRLEDVPFYKLT